MRRFAPDIVSVFVIIAVALPAGPGCRAGADASFSRGEQALAAGHPDSAIVAFKRALAIDPNRGDVHLSLARIYMKREQWSPAANALREASRLDPRLRGETDPLLREALHQAALQHLRMGDRAAAIEALRELHAMAPGDPEVRGSYLQALSEDARAQIRNGNYGDGVLALREILRLDPGNPEAHQLLRRIRFSDR